MRTLFQNFFNVLIFNLLLLKLFVVRNYFKSEVFDLLCPQKIILVEVLFEVANSPISTCSASIMWFIIISWKSCLRVFKIGCVRVYIKVSFGKLVTILFRACLLVNVHLLLNSWLHLRSTSAISLASIIDLLLLPWILNVCFILSAQDSLFDVFRIFYRPIRVFFSCSSK